MDAQLREERIVKILFLINQELMGMKKFRKIN
jgi:hypothetical protein